MTAPERPSDRTPATPNPARRFTDLQLLKLLDLSTSVDCECPNHLAEIISKINAFETYSEQCFNRDDKDVHVHRMLYVETGHTRYQLENVLIKLCEFENISLDTLK